MTDIAINPVTRRVQFVGTTGTGPFAFSFNILQASDIAVYKNNTLLTIGTGATNYSVSINTNGTGSVSVVTALIATDVLVIIGGRELSRTTDFVTAGDLLASSLNEQLDSNVVMSQQLDESIDRSIRAQPGDSLKTLTLPLVADRASEILTFDASGNVTTTPVSEIVGADIDTQKVTIKTSAGATKLVINGNVSDLITAADNLTIASTSGDIDLKPGGGQVNILAAGGQQRILFDNSAQATMKYFQNSNTTTLGVVDPTGTRALLLPDASDTLVGKATTDTLTNKTLASPVITGSLAVGTLTNSGTDITLDSSGDIVLDADGGQIYFKDGGATKLTWNLGGSQDLVSNDEFTLKTDSSGISLQPQTGNTDFLTNSGNQAFQVNASGSSTITYYQNSNTTKLGVVNPTGTRTLLLPDASDTLVGKDTTDTLTNKTLASPTITGSLAVGTLTNSGSDIILDSSGDITLDADGGEIYFKDGGATRLTFQVSAVAAQLNSASDFNVNSANDIALQPAGGQVDILGTSGQQRIQFDNSASPFVKYYQNSNTTTLGVVNPTGARALLLPDASDTLVGKATTDTLTNKTLTSPTITGSLDMSDVNITNVGSISLDKITNDGGAGITLDSSSNIIIDASSGTFFFKDDNVTRLTVAINNSASQSITSLADLTLVSGDDTFIKPSGGQVYIQTSAGADNFQFNTSSTPTLGIHQNSNVTNLGLVDPTATRTILFPDASDTLVGKATTDTLTNKTLTAPTLTGTTVVASLDISGDIDVDGTTNLDVVDIDGAVDMASTLQVDGVLTTTAATVFNGGFASNADSTVGGTLTATKLVSANGVLELDDNGSHNGIINSPASLLLNIDSDNGATNEKFEVAKDRTSTSGGTVLFTVNEDGSAAFSGAVTANAGVVVDNFTLDGTTLKLSSGVLRIENNDIRLKTSGDETMLRAIADGSVELMHNNVKTFATNSSGIELGDNDGTSILRAGGANTHLTLGAMGVSGTIKFGAGASNGTIGSTKMTLDASGNLLVGKSALGISNVGHTLAAAGYVEFTRSGAAALNVGRNSSDGAMAQFFKDGTGVGSINSRAGVVMTVTLDPRSGGAGISGGGPDIYPTDNVGGLADDRVSFGASNGYRFKNMFLSGGVYLGGVGSGNKLDEYEEGTFTGTLTSATPPSSPPTATGHYTKIGRSVLISIFFENVNTSGGSGSMVITGLPYAAGGALGNRGNGPVQFYNMTFPGEYAVAEASASQVNFRGISSNAAWQDVSITAGTGKYLQFSLTYTQT